MSRRMTILAGIAGCAVLLGFLLLLETSLRRLLPSEDPIAGVYHSLPADTSTEDPLLYLDEDFNVLDGFHSNLPIVIISLDEPLANYKRVERGVEYVNEDVEPWVGGSLKVIGVDSSEPQLNRPTDTPSYESRIRIKRRGFTSYNYGKSQFLVKSEYPDGTENQTRILGLGEGHSWILNGTVADKSMIRNYLAYRLCSETSGSAMAPDSRYCEVLFAQEDGSLQYRGVYLLTESVARGSERVNIDKFKKKNLFTSYIVRRDRYKNFDIMLDTYGRLNGLPNSWIGLKYPSEERITPAAKAFIEQDFSRIEQVLYSENYAVFRTYDRYIDMESFVDYFLLNEFFNNYDAGVHSTYMYKNSGGKLHMGPVWDFDQAMNNYNREETGVDYLAFQTAPFFQQLTQDKVFVRKLKERYRVMRSTTLRDEHILDIIEETTAYLRSAQPREWACWAELYEGTNPLDPRYYALYDYEQDEIVMDRHTADYEQEVRTVGVYLTRHAEHIQPELDKLLDRAEWDTEAGANNKLLFFGFLFLMLAIGLISKRTDG